MSGPEQGGGVPGWLDLWASGPLGLLLDFDGTLAEIVLEPAAARPRPGALSAVRALAARDDVRLGVVSGRALDDLAARLGPVPGAWLAGSHGAELRDPRGQTQVLVEAGPARQALGSFLEQARALGGPGLRVEDKGQAVAVHLRGLPSARAEALSLALSASARALCADAPVSWLEGKAVLELRARGASKGAAAEALLERWGAGSWALLAAGDDRTDEELFAAVLARGGVAIKVGPGESRAGHRVADPAGFERLLLALAQRLAGRAQSSER